MQAQTAQNQIPHKLAQYMEGLPLAAFLLQIRSIPMAKFCSI